MWQDLTRDVLPDGGVACTVVAVWTFITVVIVIGIVLMGRAGRLK